MRAEKILGLANSVLAGNRGEALKLIAKGAQLWADPNAKPEEKAAAQPAQPAPGAPPAQNPPAQSAAPATPHQQTPAGYGPPAVEGLEPDEWAILRVMAAAAQSDGQVSPHEQNTILGQANKLGASPDQLQQLTFELHQRAPIAQIVQSVDSVAARKLMYQFAFAMVQSDRQVTQSEMSFLTELARATELSHDVLGALVRQ